jgi:hypothetical protein
MIRPEAENETANKKRITPKTCCSTNPYFRSRLEAENEKAYGEKRVPQLLPNLIS